MSTADSDNNNKDDIPDVCANCGKGEESTSDLKKCAACLSVKYCSRDCQIAHRPQHKKECKKRAAEIHEELLFKEPPTLEDCPICFQRLPMLLSGRKWYGCCGKILCTGCVFAPVYDDKGNVITEKTCPFCRTPLPTSEEEIVQRIQKRIKLNDANAIYYLGSCYAIGDGYPQDYVKALELWHQAGELGHAASNLNIAQMYMNGEGVEANMKKAIHYWELAAMRGDAMARHNLGNNEWRLGNMDRALKHYMIAVKDGESASLGNIQRLYFIGQATKDEYTKALQAYQTYLGGIKSDQRDKAAAANEDYKYY